MGLRQGDGESSCPKELNDGVGTVGKGLWDCRQSVNPRSDPNQFFGQKYLNQIKADGSPIMPPSTWSIPCPGLPIG